MPTQPFNTMIREVTACILVSLGRLAPNDRDRAIELAKVVNNEQADSEQRRIAADGLMKLMYPNSFV